MYVLILRLYCTNKVAVWSTAIDKRQICLGQRKYPNVKLRALGEIQVFKPDRLSAKENAGLDLCCCQRTDDFTKQVSH